LNSTEASTAARIEDAKGVAAAERQAVLGERVRSLRLPAEVRSHRSGTSLVAWLLALVMAGAAGTLGFLYYQQVSRNAAAAGGSNPPPSGAGNGGNAGATDDSKAAPGLAAPAAANGSIALEAKGYVIPRRQILVSPQVNGRLLKVMFEEGQRVARDQVLAEIETTDYLADHQRALAAAASSQQRLQELESGNRPEEIAQAEAELAEARALLPQAEAEWKRNDELRASRTIAQLQFEQSEATYLSLKKRVDRLEAAVALMRKGPRQERIEAARADVRQAEADVARTKWRLDNCTVRAPISGTILKKNAEEGNIVNPIAFNGSFSLCDMADLSDLEVELFIQERDIARVFVGQHCKVRAEAYPDRTYDGVVSRLMPIADRAKGAVPVRVKLTVPADEEGVYLKPEMGAVVTFLNASTDGQPAAVSSTRGP
jgi:multidrug resistance efflux pump